MTKLSLIVALLAATFAINSASAFAGETKHIYGTSNKNCAVRAP